MTTRVRYVECSAALGRGDWEQARKLTDLLLRDSPDSYSLLATRIEVECQTGNHAEARRYLDHAIEVAGQGPRPSRIPTASAVVAIGRAAYISGHLELVPTARQLARALLADSPNPTLDGWTRTGLGFIAALEGNVEEARAQYEKKIASRGQAADFFDASILGLLARTFGEFGKALAHLRYARDHMAHERPRYGWICYELAKTLLEARGAVAAEETRALMEESLSIARELGMPPLEERVSRDMATLGVAKCAPATPAGLSSREVQVLRLLAKGRSNKEIGFELGISQKTVMNHVTSIYAKIGAGNRVEAALFSAKHGLDE